MDDGTGKGVTHRIAEQVHPLFVANGWTYHDTDPEPPSVERLASGLDALVEHVLTPPTVLSSASGRFLVRKIGRRGVRIYLDLGDDELMFDATPPSGSKDASGGSR